MFTEERVKFKIPSKTFLFGEYGALADGPALVLAHGPYFEVSFVVAKNKNPFHPDSPAGVWIDLHEDIFKNISIDFKDPYGGRGGFGASTAQFIAVYLYVLWSQKMFTPGNKLTDLQKWAIVEDYKNLFFEEDIVPSGYDVMAQLGRGLQLIHAKKKSAGECSWPFPDTKITIYKTNQKVNTHEHLSNVSIDDETIGLILKSADVLSQAFLKKDKESFFKNLAIFSLILQKAGCVDELAQERVKNFLNSSDVLFARGCGALGADVLSVFSSKDFIVGLDLINGLDKVWDSTVKENTEQEVSVGAMI